MPCAVWGEVQAVLSKWRADTLKVNAYDGDVARISVPPSVDARWCQAVADPMLDLSYPMKGPLPDPARRARGWANVLRWRF